MNWVPIVLTGFVGLTFGWLSTIFSSRKQMIDELSALAAVKDKLDKYSSEYQEVSRVVKLQTFRVVAAIRYPPLLRPELFLLIVALLSGTVGVLSLSQMLRSALDELVSNRVWWVVWNLLFLALSAIATFGLVRRWSARAKMRFRYVLSRIDDTDELGDVREVIQAAQASLVALLGIITGVNLMTLTYSVMYSPERRDSTLLVMTLAFFLGLSYTISLASSERYSLAPNPSKEDHTKKLK